MKTNSRPNKEHTASALSYDGYTVPTVVAQGSGDVASTIEQIAARHNIPVVKDRRLMEVLATVPTGEDVPPELYRAVATVLAYVWELEGRSPSS